MGLRLRFRSRLWLSLRDRGSSGWFGLGFRLWFGDGNGGRGRLVVVVRVVVVGCAVLDGSGLEIDEFRE